MKKWCFWGVFMMGVLICAPSFGQTVKKPAQKPLDSITVGHKGADVHYREDQFYVSLTFNLLSNMPSGVKQSGFSGGIHAGFIRDIPLNKRRNVALGIGLGWSINSFRSNLLISRTQTGTPIFQVLDPNDFDYDLNSYATQLIEIPIQFRWRTSSPTTYKFWRIYTGFRLGYMYRFRSNFKQPGNHISLTDVEGLNRLRYGLTFTFGYNTFNFTVYYSLNPFFDAHTVDGQDVGLSTFKVGLMFYIL